MPLPREKKAVTGSALPFNGDPHGGITSSPASKTLITPVRASPANLVTCCVRTLDSGLWALGSGLWTLDSLEHQSGPHLSLGEWLRSYKQHPTNHHG
ncbi:uncharacterized protein UV8b_01908 [Ustilaginoidea virens]|uniref:Uncharacterized protein n=1 Tax=Ustilaginoidea virens TaxID=1159556 RepID=A0A8E5HLT8_USTVR|nr:uncharacterized protein UV8b_01908 [Ustilaginoidea virens]QUC17667.1 hypothetical protein UV8b_01908 [Ustilaginoidea virens]